MAAPWLRSSATGSVARSRDPRHLRGLTRVNGLVVRDDVSWSESVGHALRPESEDHTAEDTATGEQIGISIFADARQPVRKSFCMPNQKRSPPRRKSGGLCR